MHILSWYRSAEAVQVFSFADVDSTLLTYDIMLIILWSLRVLFASCIYSKLIVIRCEYYKVVALVESYLKETLSSSQAHLSAPV